MCAFIECDLLGATQWPCCSRWTAGIIGYPDYKATTPLKYSIKCSYDRRLSLGVIWK